MPLPERTYEAEFYEIEPPVMPVKFTIRKGRGAPGVTSATGWEGFRVFDSGRGKFKVMKTGDFTVKVLPDGYAEIPATEYNKKKLQILSKPTIIKATYDRGVSVDVDDPKVLWFKDDQGQIKRLTEKAQKDGEIRKISKETTAPPTVKPLKSVRKFDMSNAKEAELCEKVRPWLSAYVKVNGAQMEAPAI